MIDQFQLNLSLMLAHSVMYEAKAAVPQGVPHDWAKNWSDESDIPSARESTSGVYGALVEYLPSILQTISKELPGLTAAESQASWDATSTYAPKYSDLAYRTLLQYYPSLSNLQSAVYEQQAPRLAQAGANANLQVLQNYGQPLVNQTMALDKTLNPEYYDTRQQASGVIGQMMNGGLTDAEREEVSRALLGGNVDRGLAGVNSNINTVANAMTFGSKARERQAQGVGLANSFLPQSRSTLDASNIALGNNSWQSKFLGVGDTSGVTNTTKQSSDTASTMANSILSGVFGLASDNANNQASSSTPMDSVVKSVDWA